MRHVKILGLLAVTAMVTTAFAASASATTVTGPSGATTPIIHVVHEGTHVTIDNPIATIECASTAEGKVEEHGGTYAQGNFASFSFTSCTKSWHVTTISGGRFYIDSLGGNKGTVSSSAMTIEATRFGLTCSYTTDGDHIGTLTGGNPATLHLEGYMRFHSGSPLCGTNPTAWTGDYVTTGTIDID